MAVKVGRHAPKGPTAAFHPDVWDGKIAEMFLDDYSDGPALEGVGHKGMAIPLVSFPCAKDRAG